MQPNIPLEGPAADDRPQYRPVSGDDRRHLRLFLLFAAVFLAIGIGLRDPWPSDEPRYALAAQQMVASGDWMFPHRGNELYSDKPPMLMWMQAATFEVVRSWRIAFLLPSLLAGLLTLGLTWDLGRRLWNPKVGLYAAAGVLVAFQFAYQVKRAQIDPLEMGWITLANWGLLLHFLRGPDWRAYWIGCFAAGLGVITKGVGFLPLLLFAPYLFARVRGWPSVTRTSAATWRWLGGALAFFAAIALWLVPMLVSARLRATGCGGHGCPGPDYNAYVSDILFHQTAGRYAESWAHRHPFWYFVPIVLFNWFPLSLGYIGAAPRWWRDLREGETRVVLPLAWAVLVVLFFSIPMGKRDVYILPVLPMVALAMAPYLDGIVRARWLRITAFVVALLGGLLLLAFGLFALHGAPVAAKMAQQRGLEGGAAGFWWTAVGIGAAFLAAAAWFRVRRGLHALLAGITALWIGWSTAGSMLLNDSSSSAGLMRAAGRAIGADAELGLVDWREQNLLMADRRAQVFGFQATSAQQFERATRWQSGAPGRRWVFAGEDALGTCVDRAKARRVGIANRRTWWIYRFDAVVPGCVPKHAETKDSPDA